MCRWLAGQPECQPAPRDPVRQPLPTLLAATPPAPCAATLDFNAALFIKVITVAITVSAIVSAAAFEALRRFGGALIKASLYITLGVWIVVAGAMFTINVIAGVFMLIPVLLIALFIRLVRHRIPFAAAHLQVRMRVWRM